MNETLLPMASRNGASMRAWRLTLLLWTCLIMWAPLGAAPLQPKAATANRGKQAPAPASAQPEAAAPAKESAAPGSEAGRQTSPGDYILVVVNREMITAGELSRRITFAIRNAEANGVALPPPEEIQRQVLDTMIDEKVLLSHAREIGPRIDDAELDRVVAAQAAQLQMSVAQLKQRLAAEGTSFNTFRNSLRDQLLVERVRDREIQSRIKITDAEIDLFLEQRLQAAGLGTEYNIAQILIRIPDGASDAVVEQKRAIAEKAMARLKAGEPMKRLAAELSDDESKTRGGELGLRAAQRLPDVFLETVRDLPAGGIAPRILRTGAGFHVLQLVERRNPSTVPMTQTRASHILLRPSADLSQEQALRRLAEFKRQVLAGRKSFEDLAREYSQDGTAPQGGDLGWTLPGSFVPEFESVMNQLAVGEISDPMVSRFGTHLIKVQDRQKIPVEIKKLRDTARNALREQKSETVFAEWLQELRSRAFIEYREGPQ